MTQTKKFILSIVTLLFLGIHLYCFADRGAYTIQDYSTTINLTTGGEMHIEEDIQVHFSEPRHGIYREIPYKYKGSHNKTIKTDIYDIEIPGYKFQTQKHNNNYEIKIGSPDSTVNGTQNYKIKYTVYGGVRNFSGYQEVYRNVIGNGRNTSTDKFNFEFYLPTNLDLKDSEYYAIRGQYGERNPVKLGKEGNRIFSTEKIAFNPNEAVTIAIKLPPNYIQKDWTKEFPREYLILLFPLGFIGYLYNLWRKYGKDDPIRDIIYYTLPKGYTPIEIESIYKQGIHEKAFFTLIYTRATNGYIKIKQEKGGLLEKDTFSLEKTKELPDTDLNSFEKKIFNSIFKENTVYTFRDSEIEDKHLLKDFKKEYEKAYKEIEKNIFTEESIKWKNSTLNKVGIIVLPVIAILCMGGTIITSISIRIAWGALLIFNQYIYKFNPKGIETYEQIQGYKKYLKTVEEPKLKLLIKQDPQYFEKVLPFAIALGMQTEWIKKCSTALQEINYTPLRIYGSGFNNDISNISSSLNNSMQGFGEISAFSSSSGGGSSGFSGGGGGGGGGGSW